MFKKKKKKKRISIGRYKVGRYLLLKRKKDLKKIQKSSVPPRIESSTYEKLL